MASIAPQCVWPQMITLATSSTSTAYSMAAAVPPGMFTSGTKLPTLRTMNSSPGAALVMRWGTTRESEQVMKSVSGFWPAEASCSNSARWLEK